jgi:uncharacterized protein (TIGR00255 family)
MAHVASMTGFADATRAAADGSKLTVELRSVNNRFLELSLRLPDELRAAEGRLRELVAASLSRGKVDCRVGLARESGGEATHINPAVLDQLARLSQLVHAALPQVQPLRVADVLRWPGAIEGPAAVGEALQEPLLAALESALEGLVQSRRREGAALATALLERCTGIEAVVVRLREVVPRILAETERRTQERLTQVLGAALAASTLSREEISDRIRQEVALLGMKADIAEELDRLGTHVAEVRRVLAQGGGVGRRLDFLLQELNREANTVASKAAAVDMTQSAVELKLLIEQMREQVQNLE